MTRRMHLFALLILYAFVGIEVDGKQTVIRLPVPIFQGEDTSSSESLEGFQDLLAKEDEGEVTVTDRTSSMEIVRVETPSEAIRLSLAQLDLHTLASDLNEGLEREKDALEESIFNSIDGFQEHIENVAERMASNLQCNFSSRMEESVQIITKIFSLSASDIELIKDQIEKSSNAVPADIETSSTTSVPSLTFKQIKRLPKDCSEALELALPTGITTIRSTEDTYPKRVWCDQATDGGGWTIMLRREPQPIQVDFSQNWDEYVEGFGDPEGEYWIGLETLNRLTKRDPYRLRVEMRADGKEATSTYNTFRVGPGRRNYKLRVEDYDESSSTGGDALSYHSGRRFTTRDNDNDGALAGNCAEWSGEGGWWYNNCFFTNPTALYPPANCTEESAMYLEWREWRGYHVYLSHFTMMIRPKS